MHKKRQGRKPPRRQSRGASARIRKERNHSFKTGYDQGLAAGAELGRSSFGTLFEGTSIIIPTFNQADYLKKCIDSIAENTDLPYEIIVVDNASTDGTDNYLKSLSGQVRYRILETNRGFAGAINIGLMMAKGQTMLLLNNDTIVTERWLDNMLACLNSDPRIGMVGPVTNHISGNQQIDVPYTDLDEMPEFARNYNQSDPGKWVLTDRLVGFCLLFRREFWELTGYLDEGFLIGNFEDDDYNIRARLQGYMLVVARDTFIHHFGSVSIKSFGEEFAAINARNEAVYAAKWGNPHELVHQVRELLRQDWPQPKYRRDPDSLLVSGGGRAFFPQQIVVRGISDTCYWIEQGQRRPITGFISIVPARLSQAELVQWPIGEAIDAQEVEHRWSMTGIAEQEEEAMRLIRVHDRYYVIEDGRRRKVVTTAAAESWGLNHRPYLEWPEERLYALPEGLPIIAAARTADFL